MKKIDYLNQHAKPKTRREFVSLGLTLGGAAVFAPTLGSLITSSRAEAQVIPKKPIPFLVFDLAGGAALFANFLVGGKGGAQDLLPSYSMHGWDPRKTKLNTDFGIPMAGDGVSRLLVGLQQSASVDALKNFKFSTLLHRGDIDTTNNPLSAASLVNLAGTQGQYIQKSIGLRNSISGGNSQYAKSNDDYRAFFISNAKDISNAVGVSETFKSQLNPKALSKIGQLMNRLSHAQSVKFMNGTVTTDQLKHIDAKYADASKLMTMVLEGDPRKDATMSAVYGLNAGTSELDENLLRASVVQACLKGWSGPGVITINGCDYHDGTSTTGDAKDLEIGIQIGRAIEAAYRLKTPLFIQIITDGGIYPQSGTRLWSGDSVDTCMSAMGYFDPAAVPQYKNANPQIGAYTAGQGADRTTLVGDSPLFAAYSVFANYLSISGRSGEFAALTNNIFSSEQQKSIEVF